MANFLRLPLLENLDLEPFWSDEIDNALAMRHNLLFASMGEQKCSIVTRDYLAMAFNHLKVD